MSSLIANKASLKVVNDCSSSIVDDDLIALIAPPAIPECIGTGFDLLSLAAIEAEGKASQKVTKGIVQTRNPLNQPYMHDNKVPVPFRVSLCLSIAEHVMQLQKVDFVPLAVVLAIAKELNLDLRMQGRSSASQIKQQAKDLKLGIFAEQTFKVGNQEGKLVGLKVNPAKLDALRGCRFSLLPAES